MIKTRMKTVAVIPARGGSKRFPGKNIIDFFGKPIIAYAIEAAYEANVFDRICVSSDSDEILTISEKYDAIAVKRQPEMASDHVSSATMLLDFLDQEEKENRKYDILTCLYATAVLRTAEDIRQTVKLINPGICDFAMGVSESDRQAHQALQADQDGFLQAMWPELVEKQSQDVGPLWFSNGSTYAVNIPAFREHKTLYGPNLKGFYMPRNHAIDIDFLEDLELAKYYYRQLHPVTKS